jgi:hypothetical protein
MAPHSPVIFSAPNQGISVVTCPGKVTEITPAHTHIHFDVLFRVGLLSSNTVREPGTQGVTVFGMHGIGVNVPEAALVAAATVGFAMELHIPNGIIFSIDTWSVIFAAGTPLLSVILVGSTIRLLGAEPKLH